MSTQNEGYMNLMAGITTLLAQAGINDYIIIIDYKGDNMVNTRMSPQKAMLYLIDSLQAAKEKCLEQPDNGSGIDNNE